MWIKNIVNSKLFYFHTLIGVIVICILMYIQYLFIYPFLWWSLFGEGNSSNSEYHPIAEFTFNILPLITVLVVIGLLLKQSLKQGKYKLTKSYCFLFVFAFVIYVFKEKLLDYIFYKTPFTFFCYG